MIMILIHIYIVDTFISSPTNSNIIYIGAFEGNRCTQECARSYEQEPRLLLAPQLRELRHEAARGDCELQPREEAIFDRPGW